MMTIDDMLVKVAEITGAAPPKIASPAPAAENVKKEPVPNREASLPNIGVFGTSPVLRLSLAKEIIYCVECGAKKAGVNAVISVVNPDGRLIAFEAMDNSLLASVRASQDKAYTAVALKMPTHEALKESRGGAFDGLTNGGGILLLGGGYPLTVNDMLLGAIGVSGGTKEEDMALALLGVRYLEARIKSMSQTKEAIK